MPFGKALSELREAEVYPTDAPGLTVREGTQYLPRTHITMLENVFQHRTAPENDFEREQHLRQLTNALERMPKGQKHLDPILVKQVDNFWLCIDGHHRMSAYEKRGIGEVPVSVFAGSIDEAIQVAGAENLKAKLMLSHRDRSNLAWRLTTAEIGTKKSVVEKSGISDGTVAKMRRLRKKLIEEGYKPENLTYAQAQDAAKGQLRERGGNEWEERMLAECEDKLKRAFGKTAHKNSTFIAAAIENIYPSIIDTIIDRNAADYREQIEYIFKEIDEGVL